MSDGELICNFKKCRKILTETAFITRCSHVFCEEDGMREIQSQNGEKRCPACETPLIQSYHVIKADLNPGEQFKSMVLAGIRPEYVMDIATRAILFWTYQLHQENLHQKIVAKNGKDALGQMKSELQILKRKVNELERELQEQSQKCAELTEKLTQKCRESQKWQMEYESLRRKQLSELVLHRDENQGQSVENSNFALNIGPQTMDDILKVRNKPRGVVVNEEKDPRRHHLELNVRRQAPNVRVTENMGPNPSFNFQPQMSHYVSPKIVFDREGCKPINNAKYYDK